MRFVDKEEVVEVAADFFCRCHRSIDVKISPVRVSRKNSREHGHLNPVRKGELCFDLSPLGSDLRDLIGVAVDLPGHVRDICTEPVKLIPGVHFRQAPDDFITVFGSGICPDTLLDLIERAHNQVQKPEYAQSRQCSEEQYHQAAVFLRECPDRPLKPLDVPRDADQIVAAFGGHEQGVIVHIVPGAVRCVRRCSRHGIQDRLPLRIRNLQLSADRIDLTRFVAAHVVFTLGNEQDDPLVIRLLGHDAEQIICIIRLLHPVDSCDQPGVGDLRVQLLILLRKRLHILCRGIFRQKVRMAFHQETVFLGRPGIRAVIGIVLDVHLRVVFVPVVEHPFTGRILLDMAPQIHRDMLRVFLKLVSHVSHGERIQRVKRQQTDRHHSSDEEHCDLGQHTDLFFLFSGFVCRHFFGILFGISANVSVSLFAVPVRSAGSLKINSAGLRACG